MSSLLQSTQNTRALPTGTLRYIRSDAPENLTDKEIKWLTAAKPYSLKKQDGFRYFHLPVTGGGDTPNWCSVSDYFETAWIP